MCTSEIREDNILGVRKLPVQKKQKIQKSKQILERKYKCDKCARSYTRKEALFRHKTFECGVLPQFKCEFCGKKFTRKCNMNTHINDLHLKPYFNSSRVEYNCDKCSRSYNWISNLNRHKRAEHAPDKREFICESCGFKAKEKSNLSKHILSRHLK